MYYEFQEQVNKIAGHRVLALNRGEKEKMLTDQDRWRRRNAYPTVIFAQK